MDEILGEAQDVDLSDLGIVILNVETRDGRQLSMQWACEDGQLAVDGPKHFQGRRVERWTFIVAKRS